MNREMLLLVDALAHEKNVDREIVFNALELALASATKKKYTNNTDIQVDINPEDGSYKSFRCWTVVNEEEYENEEAQLLTSDDKAKDLEIGHVIREEIPSVEFGRIGAQAAKQVILQKIRQAEREQLLKDFLARDEKLISGQIKRMERGNAIIEIGKLEAMLPRDQMIPKENLRVGDRIRATLLKIEESFRGPQLILSRTSPEFIIKLFELEVPEIDEGLLEIMSASRDPGSRSKIAVKANDQRLDPVGTCVGMRGARVQAVTNELSGERVDIVLWSMEPAQYVINAMAPAEVSSITVDEVKKSMDVVVEEDQLALAIGRNGQNIRLASQLTGWELNIMNEEESAKKHEEEYSSSSQLFMEKLDVDEEVADILVKEGFASLEEIAYVPEDELNQMDIFDADTIEELRSRAKAAILTAAIANEEKVQEPSEDLKNLEGMTAEIANALAKQNIVSMEDLAELSIDEVLDVISIDEDLAKNLILAARAPWFEESGE
jgi:N utilization substance protein A